MNNPAFSLVLIVLGVIILISGILGTTGAMLSGLIYGNVPTTYTPAKKDTGSGSSTPGTQPKTQLSGTPTGPAPNVA